MVKPIIIYFILLAISIAAIRFAFFCLKKAGEAYRYAAKLSVDKELRSQLSRKTVLARDKQSFLTYAFANPGEFDKYNPLKMFKFKGVKCVFYDYYFPSRHRNNLSVDQRFFCDEIFEFKNNKRNGIDFFGSCIEVLAPQEEYVVMFIPCSKDWRYRRFQSIAYHIEDFFPQLTHGFDYITYTGERKSLHSAKKKSERKIERNYYINHNLKGNNCNDDLLTIGQSLMDFKEQIKKKGGEVVYAIFMAKTFQTPDKLDVWFTALLHK
ncbi:orotate phosphoribosyltransferase [Bacteroides sp. 51]|uniref:orotate phosphoribosyltransferase n=1 Tax=Bacteroides sp. 51 TaxID=2302938 RepID=UPI0013D62DEB|nr:orotate phosphoribosyltransferase [Bacteroides sp. 51]NDV82573.1 orotate phosphoribosyltransferase [Bacteroides sp. 51]